MRSVRADKLSPAGLAHRIFFDAKQRLIDAANRWADAHTSEAYIRELRDAAAEYRRWRAAAQRWES